MTTAGHLEVEEALARLRHTQDQLNACTLIDDRVKSKVVNEGSLLGGMPIVVKDLIDQDGLPTTCGSAFLRDPAASNAAVINRVEEAGAVVVGRAGLHEFAYGFSSENPWFGPIRNPWDPLTSPGGSSGGSAVAVAAGLVPAAIGTDTGGSVRVPAAMTGIFGLKVTYGRIPTTGVFPLAPSLDTVGPLARDTTTLDLLYRAMSGEKMPAVPRDVRGLRIGVPRLWNDFAPTEAAIVDAFGAAMGQLESLGAVAVVVDDPRIAPWGKIQELAGAEAAHVHRPFRSAGKPYGPEVGARLDAAEKVTPEAYLEAHRWRADLVEAFVSAFSQVDLLATPAVAARRKVIGEDLIEGEPYRPVLSWFSALVNHAGVPAIAVPLIENAGPAQNVPPASLQLVAPWLREDLLLGVAAHLEREGLIGFQPPPIFLS